MNTKPEIRYTQGPEKLNLGDVELTRADLDTAKGPDDAPLNGWREVSDEIAESATRPGFMKEYGAEARNYTRPQAEAAQADAAPAKKTRSK